jgi:hypothetical protein
MLIKELLENTRLPFVIAVHNAKDAVVLDQSDENKKRYYYAIKALRDFDTEEQKKWDITPHPIIVPEKEDTYRGQHEAPDHERGCPLYDLTLNGIYPNDVYSFEGYRLYSSSKGENYCLSLAQGFRNRPNGFLSVYRSLPKSVKTPRGKGINIGDWVAIRRGYCIEHGRANLNNNYRIVKLLVHPRDIFTDGDSLEEWGYDPQPRVQKIVDKPL